MVYVTHGDERARVFPEGGIGFDRRVRGVGWVVCDRPGVVIARLALAVRAAAYPTLEPIGERDLAGDVITDPYPTQDLTAGMQAECIPEHVWQEDR